MIGMTLVAVMLGFGLSSCDKNIDNPTTDTPELPDNQIVILYENDVHCAVDGYAKLAAQRNLHKTSTPYVSTVSCGDFASGNIVGMVSSGEYIVNIMNKVGYDVVTLGNHELDYGMPQMLKLTEALEAPVVCANLMNIQTQEHLYPAYQIISYDNVDIAYIGFTTTTSAKNLRDENGNVIYSFMRDEFYQNAQYWIDDARQNGADYVVALAHLGDMDRGNGHPSSIGLIANTTGLDAVIDGHDHHVIEQKMIENKEGNPVLLTSSGTGFQYVGKLVLTQEGTFESSLINIQDDNTMVDEEIQQYVDAIKEEAESSGKQVVGYNETDLSIYNADGTRIVRKQETGIGNFLADAFRSYTQSDVALVNGGGIRADLKKGDISFNDIITVMPFKNEVNTATMTGQQLLDVLEFAVSFLPNENGVFMQVSGMKFVVNADIPSPVVIDRENNLFSHVGEGERRVSDLQIWDNEEAKYKPVDLSRIYTLSSFDYLLLSMGDLGILRYATPIDTYWGLEVESVIYYLQNILNGRIGASYAQPEGRIVIL